MTDSEERFQERFQERFEAFDRRLTALEAEVEAVRGLLGGVEAVDEAVERRASIALAKAEALERALDADDRGLVRERLPGAADRPHRDDDVDSPHVAGIRDETPRSSPPARARASTDDGGQSSPDDRDQSRIDDRNQSSTDDRDQSRIADCGPSSPGNRSHRRTAAHGSDRATTPDATRNTDRPDAEGSLVARLRDAFQ